MTQTAFIMQDIVNKTLLIGEQPQICDNNHLWYSFISHKQFHFFLILTEVKQQIKHVKASASMFHHNIVMDSVHGSGY